MKNQAWWLVAAGLVAAYIFTRPAKPAEPKDVKVIRTAVGGGKYVETPIVGSMVGGVRVIGTEKQIEGILGSIVAGSAKDRALSLTNLGKILRPLSSVAGPSQKEVPALNPAYSFIRPQA